MNNNVKSIFIFTVFLILGGCLSISFYMYSKNRLANHQEWKSLKAQSPFFVNGSLKYNFRRSTLFQNSLQLNRFLGHDGIELKQSLKSPLINLSFNLSENAYYFILFESVAQNKIKIGLRVSSDPSYPSSFILFDGYKFKETFLLPVKNQSFEANKEHILKFNFNNSSLEVNNEKVLFPKFLKFNNEFKFSIKANEKLSVIDNISIFDNNKRLQFYEDFSNTYNKPEVIKHITIFSVILLIIFILISYELKLILFGGYIFYFITIGLFYTIDYTLWSKNYYDGTFSFEESVHENLKLSLEKFRLNLFYDILVLDSVDSVFHEPKGYEQGIKDERMINNCSINFLKGDAAENFKMNCKKKGNDQKKYSIGFIGSSQTSGTGASKFNKTFVSKIAVELSRISNCEIEVINTSVSGFTTSDAITHFNKFYSKEKFNHLIYNLNFNDEEPGYKKRYEKLLSTTKADRKLIVHEPHKSVKTGSFDYKYKASDDLAKELNIPVVYTLKEQWLLNNQKIGILFWDEVHFNDLGHHYFYKSIIKTLKKQLKESKLHCFKGIL